ncbi:hypothetical protein B0T21DRAFT_97526 [Apiosordaria backusii]|uniref:Uncharacterized protein n=1 Tax=Apiosordaria backusii TaxID=314023 RepID=A0AA40K3Z7_9PEZI|nr:hypothetical protein B0T21DRAFT_97526 [Apiosordaria backusii]
MRDDASAINNEYASSAFWQVVLQRLFWEEDYAVICEQPPDSSRRRVDIVVRRFERGGNNLVNMVFIECKKTGESSKEVEKQASNAAMRAVTRDGLSSVFTMATIGTSCRIWDYGTELKTLKTIVGDDGYLKADNYQHAREILEAVLHIKRNPPKESPFKGTFRRILPKPASSGTAAGQSYTSPSIGQGPSTHQGEPPYEQQHHHADSTGYGAGVQVAPHDYRYAGLSNDPSQDYYDAPATGRPNALPSRTRASEEGPRGAGNDKGRAHQPKTPSPPRTQRDRERSPLVAQPQATPGRRSQSPPQASAGVSSKAEKPQVRVKVKRVSHMLSVKYEFEPKRGSLRSTSESDWTKKTIDGKRVWVYEGSKTTYYTEKLG